MDGNHAPGQIYGLFNCCQYKIGTPEGVVSEKKKKKKGHLLIRSEFGVIHRPRNAIITAAIPQVLTFFFGDHPFGFAGFSIKKSGQALNKQDVW